MDVNCLLQSVLQSQNKNNYLPFRLIVLPFICENFNPIYQIIFVSRLVAIGQLFLRKDRFFVLNVFSLFHCYLRLKKGKVLHLNKLFSLEYFRNSVVQNIDIVFSLFRFYLEMDTTPFEQT
mgnify:CR=1 FL=1